MHRPLALTITAAALLAGGAGSAAASTVSVAPPAPGFGHPTVQYAAAPGEANALTADFDESRRHVTVTDTGALITPGTGCAKVDAHTATCATADSLGFDNITADLGDGDDRATADGGALHALGGAGEDVLTAQANSLDNVLDGGPGADHLIALGGFVTFVDGDPDADPQPDVMEAKDAFSSSVSYAGRKQAVTIDLEAGVGGAPGEHDTIKGVGEAEGGAGDDRLVSGPDTEILTGGAGDDTFVNTRSGDLHMYWYGNAGQDTYKCASPSKETINDPEHGELIGDKCTFISDHFWTQHDPVPVSRTTSSVALRLECPTNTAADDRHRDCNATLKLTDPASGAKLGTGTFAQPKGVSSTKLVVVALNRRGQKLERKHKAVDASLSAPRYSTLTWTFKL